MDRERAEIMANVICTFVQRFSVNAQTAKQMRSCWRDQRRQCHKESVTSLAIARLKP